MFNSISRGFAPAALRAVVAVAGFHCAIGVASPADPLDATAKVPPPVYESSLARYRPYLDAKPIGWREANDTVERIGGWRAYAREARQPDAAAGATSGPQPAPIELDKAKPVPQGKSTHKSP